MRKENVIIALDKSGHKVVIINSIIFYGKKNIPWDEVELYLKKYIGEIVEVSETQEMIHIGSDFPDEFKGSKDTQHVKGANAKAKANLVQGIKQMIQISRKVSENKNRKEKNAKKAPGGWYRYLTRFALPVLTENNCISHYNVYIATLIVRVNKEGILKLYDVINVRKEVSSPFEL